MSETLLPIVQTINSYLSDYILFIMLIAVGLCYSIKTRLSRFDALAKECVTYLAI